MRKFAAAAALAGLMLLPGAAKAQVPPDLAKQIREAGQSMDPAIGRIYAPLFAVQDSADVRIARDLAYGPDTFQKLDVYTPAVSATQKRPVVLFVHGGGFTRGDKHGDFSPNNMTAWAARNGMVGVNINYRLAPAHPWPAGAQDLASAIAWTRANISSHGGDPDRIILWGHSAGANHVADYVGHKELHGGEAAAVKGAVLLSPNYPDAVSAQPNPYYGADVRLQTIAPTIERLAGSGIPLFLGYAEFDPDMMKQTASSLYAGLCRSAAKCPTQAYLQDHNHFTEGTAVGTDDQSLTGPLLRWMQSIF